MPNLSYDIGSSYTKARDLLGCRHSSVDSSTPPRVRVPSTPSTPLSFIVKFVLYLSCEKSKNKQKEAGFGPFFLKKTDYERHNRYVFKLHILPHKPRLVTYKSKLFQPSTIPCFFLSQRSLNGEDYGFESNNKVQVNVST